MRTRHAVWALAVGFGLAAVAVVTTAPAYTPVGDSLAGPATLLLAGWSMFTAAFVISQPSGGRTVAPMLTAAGVAWFAAELANPGAWSAAAFTFGILAGLVCPAFVGWAMLAHPGARLHTNAERVAVGSTLIVLLGVGGVLASVFHDPAAEGCTRCPPNLFLVHADAGAHQALTRSGYLLGAVICSVLIVIGVMRLIRSSAAVRRVILLPTLFATIYLGIITVSYARSFQVGFTGTGPVDRRLWLGEAAALTGLGAAFIWGRVRTVRSRASLASLAVEVGESARSGVVRDGLARAVDDETLTIAYPVGEGSLADAEGMPWVEPADLLTTPLVSQGRAIAVLGHHEPLSDLDIADDIAPAVRLALDHERLRAEVYWRTRELQRSRKQIVEAMDAERRKLERDLHDGAQQRLITIVLELGLLCETIPPTTEAFESLVSARAEMQGAIDHIRELARGIHPVVLSDHGLAAAVEYLEESSTTLTVRAVPRGRFPEVVEATAYRLVAESARSGPTSVWIGRDEDRLVVEVHTTTPPVNLIEFGDRVGALGGTLQVENSRPGFRATAEIPCA